MATYTVEVRAMVENHFDLGLKDYPIFDENYRGVLNQKILEHYYFREIGFETASLFKFYLNRTMNEIMPYYNQLYKSELLEFNPFYNVDQVTTADRLLSGNRQELENTKNGGETTTTQDLTNTNSTTSQGNASSNTVNHDIENSTMNQNHNQKDVFSDTPQGLLRIGNISNEIYASTADFEEDETNRTDNKEHTNHNDNVSSSTETVLSDGKQQGSITNSQNTSTDTSHSAHHNDTENYLNHVIGKSPGETYSEMLIKYRDTFLNIDMMIIEELKDLFMNVF